MHRRQTSCAATARRSIHFASVRPIVRPSTQLTHRRPPFNPSNHPPTTAQGLCSMGKKRKGGEREGDGGAGKGKRAAPPAASAAPASSAASAASKVSLGSIYRVHSLFGLVGVGSRPIESRGGSSGS